ncbi:hypothetical protein OPIT5_29965 [Opitutaceae bacterium TAV5]|nr:hypothetical protein OPIT5_29965 [Opitutaceae bacterium TAV5]
MAQICIIGTEGAGKTVFISVFATRHQEMTPGFPWMAYKNRETARYVAQNWSILADQQDWPPSTPAGTLPSLEWELHTPDGVEHTMKVQDAPGQDIRAIFDSPPEDLNEKQTELLRTIRESDILLFLINPGEAIRAATAIERADVEIPIAMALRNVLERNTRAAILLSLHDQLLPYFDSIGVPRSDPLEAIRACLPTVYGIIRNAGDRLKAFYVASIAETVPFVDNQGNARSRPKAQFESEGLAELMIWLTMSLQDIRNDEINAEREKNAKEQSAQAEKLNAAKKKRNWWTGFALLGLFLTSLFIGTGIVDANTPTHKNVSVNKRGYRPIPQEYWKCEIKQGDVGVADDIVFFNTSQYHFEKPYIDVSFRGKQFRREYGGTLSAGYYVTWEKTYNFSWGEKDARINAYCIMDYAETESQPLTSDEKFRLQATNQTIATLISLVIAAVGAAIVFDCWNKHIKKNQKIPPPLPRSIPLPRQ